MELGKSVERESVEKETVWLPSLVQGKSCEPLSKSL